MDISGKVFVVTGGGNGIARELVLELLAKGATVAAIDLSADGLKETAQLAGKGAKLSTHTLNITDRAKVMALPKAVITKHGQVDALVNVAGIIQPFVKVNDLDFDAIERVINVNLYGTINTIKAFLPELLKPPRRLHCQRLQHGWLCPRSWANHLWRNQGSSETSDRRSSFRAQGHQCSRHRDLSRCN